MANWQTTLDRLKLVYDVWKTIPSADSSQEEKLKQFTETMQDNFPGPYVVEEYYNPFACRFDYRLKFDSEQQETMWKIKWS